MTFGVAVPMVRDHGEELPTVGILLYPNRKQKWYIPLAAGLSPAALLWEDHAMALRGKTITKAPDPDEPAQELFSQRRKPEVGQFRLQVDRQTKASFTTFEAAEEAGLEIKKGHPIVRVAVYDTVECINRIIELTKT